MKIFLTFLICLLSLRMLAVPYNTNAIANTASDTNGYFAWPTDPIADSYSATNYNGGFSWMSFGYSPLAPANSVFFYTNYGSGAGITIFTNAHLQIVDQYGTMLKTGTNGVFSIQNASGVGMTYSNGLFTITTNGATYGTITVSNVNASVASDTLLLANNGTTYPTNGTWSLFAVTNKPVSLGETNFFWQGTSNRSFIMLQYNAGTVSYSNLWYNP